MNNRKIDMNNVQRENIAKRDHLFSDIGLSRTSSASTLVKSKRFSRKDPDLLPVGENFLENTRPKEKSTFERSSSALNNK